MQQETPKKARPALSGWVMILGWVGMLIFAFHASTHMVGAGDTWVAMACGRHFLNHGVDTVEPFSANSHHAGPTEQEIKTWPGWAQWIAGKAGLETVKRWHPTGWVNQNWLTHVIFYWLTHESPFADAKSYSFNTLVYWKFAVYVLAVICVYYTARLLDVNPALAAAFACFSMFVGRSFFDVRPAGFSNLMVAVLLLILVLATYRNILYIWLIVPVIVFWCNVHGGYIYAFIVLVPFVALNLLTSFSKKRFVSIGLKGVYHTMAAGTAAFFAMIIFNPFHLTNLTHTFEVSVSRHAERWRTVNEWHAGFEWSNPVGTGFPFLVLVILCIGMPVLWLYSRLLKPRFLKAPKNELDQQRRLFSVMSRVFGWAAAIFAAWVVFISFSLIDLDASSFFVCALFVVILLLSVHKNIHFIWLQVALVLLTVWATGDKPGHGGAYVYPFVLLPCYVIVHLIASVLSERARMKPFNIVFAASAAVASLVLMVVIFNPFKFELPVWHLGQFFNLRGRLWVPRYEGQYKCSYANLFVALYLINAAAVLVWVGVWLLPGLLRRLLAQLPREEQEQPEGEPYQSARIDLSLMAIAALTVYMAYRSRRFIPIAAIAACPVLAMFIDQMARTISAAYNFHRRPGGKGAANSRSGKRSQLIVATMPRWLRALFVVAGAAVVVGLGTWWGLKFKCVYLDAWPTDPRLSSVFMRMTASDAKPFYALDFIRENKMKGKMFNYWTEGGFIAWGQDPDPNTGRTPLLLFMDGRAQAAYMIKVYDRWSEIMSGGQKAATAEADARARRQRLEAAKYKEIGDWITGQLRSENVWAVLMPSGQFDTSFVKGLEHSGNWILVFLNNKQKLFVHMDEPQAKALYEGIFNGSTFYPDDFERNLIKAHHLLRGNEGQRRQGLDLAFKAFELNQSQAPMTEIYYAGMKFSELRVEVTRFCEDYLKRFDENRTDWAGKDGYHHRIVAALTASRYLQGLANSRRDTQLAQSYRDRERQLNVERNSILQTKRW
jgi:hypothetical protein